MFPKREHLCFFTLFQFATYRSDTASSIAFENLYTFSNRRSVPYGNTSAFLPHFNLLLTRAKLQAVSLLQAFTLSPTAEVSPMGTPLLFYLISTCYIRVRHAHSPSQNAISPLHYEIIFWSVSFRITHLGKKKAATSISTYNCNLHPIKFSNAFCIKFHLPAVTF